MIRYTLAALLLLPSVAIAQTAPPANVQMLNGQPRAVTPTANYCYDGAAWVGCPATAGAGGGSNSTAGLPTSTGQKTSANSTSVVNASDSTFATTTLQSAGNTSLSTLAGTVAAAGTPAANAQTVQIVSSGVPIAVVAKGGSSLTTVQVSVGTTATLVAAARTGRNRLVITQAAAGPCYYGPANTVSASTGARLTAASQSKVYLYAGALYGVCPGGAITTDVDEEY